jgi:cytochrome bd ubiquinol oxidase subunit I
MALAAFLLWRRKLYASSLMLWIIMLGVPFPYIANTAGWLTAEVGRQPWLVYGLLRTNQGYSTNVIAGNSMFTLLGFMGLYLVRGNSISVLHTARDRARSGVSRGRLRA